MPPKNPADKKAADTAHEGAQRLQSHQPYLGEDTAEFSQRPSPETGEAAGSSVVGQTAIGGSTVTATGGTMTYWEAALALHNQQSQLLAADERFEEFASTNTWPKAPVVTNQESIARHGRLWQNLDIRQHALDEAQEALNRAGNTKQIRLNPAAPEFHPGQQVSEQAGEKPGQQ